MKTILSNAGALLLSAACAIAQAPPSAPAQNTTPAEIMPAKPGAPAGTAPAAPTTPESVTPLSPGTKAAEPATPGASTGPLERLKEAELDQVIRFIEERYVKPDSLSTTERKRATVQGLLTRLGPGASLRDSADASAGASPFRSEVIDGRIGYIRAGSLITGMLAKLDGALEGFASQGVGALLLDLRATPVSENFDLTADVCRRFCPKGKLLFSLKGPTAKEQIFTTREDPKYRGILVALVDSDTAGSAELIAATLRAHAGAMIIGQQTVGEAAEFAELALPSGPIFRVAIAEALLPEGTPVFPNGVRPDLLVDVPPSVTAEVLQQSLTGGVAPLIVESERPRMNEAALMAGTNPELDALQASQKKGGEKAKPPLRDAVLQRAVDFITTIAVYEKSQATGR